MKLYFPTSALISIRALKRSGQIVTVHTADLDYLEWEIVVQELYGTASTSQNWPNLSHLGLILNTRTDT